MKRFCSLCIYLFPCCVGKEKSCVDTLLTGNKNPLSRKLNLFSSFLARKMCCNKQLNSVLYKKSMGNQDNFSLYSRILMSHHIFSLHLCLLPSYNWKCWESCCRLRVGELIFYRGTSQPCQLHRGTRMKHRCSLHSNEEFQPWSASSHPTGFLTLPGPSIWHTVLAVSSNGTNMVWRNSSKCTPEPMFNPENLKLSNSISWDFSKHIAQNKSMALAFELLSLRVNCIFLN